MNERERVRRAWQRQCQQSRRRVDDLECFHSVRRDSTPRRQRRSQPRPPLLTQSSNAPSRAIDRPRRRGHLRFFRQSQLGRLSSEQRRLVVGDDHDECSANTPADSLECIDGGDPRSVNRRRGRKDVEIRNVITREVKTIVVATKSPTNCWTYHIGRELRPDKWSEVASPVQTGIQIVGCLRRAVLALPTARGRARLYNEAVLNGTAARIEGIEDRFHSGLQRELLRFRRTDCHALPRGIRVNVG